MMMGVVIHKILNFEVLLIMRGGGGKTGEYEETKGDSPRLATTNPTVSAIAL
jgi:hypothetical protein